jgi:hypothetical protein
MTHRSIQWPRDKTHLAVPAEDFIAAIAGEDLLACKHLAETVNPDAADVLAAWFYKRYQITRRIPAPGATYARG